MKLAPNVPETKGDITRKKIRLAIIRIEKGRPIIVKKGRKLSISSAAEEAGITAATIHNHHPDMADLIRQKIGRDIRKEKNEIFAKVQNLKNRIKKLTNELAEINNEFALLASANATLTRDNDRLIAIIKSENVHVLPSKPAS